MRYSLFDNKTDAETYTVKIQAACDNAHVEEQPRQIIIPVYIQWMDKWAVTMPVEPDELEGEVVDNVEQPIEGIGEG